MIDIRTGEKVIDYLTDERRLAERSPGVADTLDALKEIRNVAEELMYQGSFYGLMQDAWKIGMPLAELPMPVFLAIANLHPDWFYTVDGKKHFLAWLRKHPGYRYYPSKIGAVKN